MAFLDIYPSKYSNVFDVKYGVSEDKSYFRFLNRYTDQSRYAVSTSLYRHIYALGNIYVLDMKTLVNGKICYVKYGDTKYFDYIYYTPKYGWVTTKKVRFLGYSPIEYENYKDGLVYGEDFYVISGIDNSKEVTEVSEITLTPRGSWIAENGSSECPGTQTGYMCWCGYISSTEEMIGKYSKVDTCKTVGADSYPMSNVDDDVLIVGTSCWKNEENGIDIFYGMSGGAKKSYYGKGFSINNGRIKAVITVDSEMREYMSDITTEEIKVEDDIVLFDTNDHDKSITIKFCGYIDSGMEIPLMLGQAAIWV